MPETPRLFVALYTDEHVSLKLAADLRANEFDAISAIEAGHAKWDDDKHLAYAAENRMAVLTFDQNFVETAKKFAETSQEHWGVVISPQFSDAEYGTLLRWTLAMLDKVTADELRNAVVFLQQFQK